MKKLILLFCFVNLIFSGFCQPEYVEFVEEEITLEINDSMISVTGLYYYHNPGKQDRNISLMYPFPQNKLYGSAENVFAFEMNEPYQNVLKRTTENAASIRLSIPANQKKTLCIGYSQKLYGNRAEYIVSTTRGWDQPLNLASFELIVPDQLKIDSLAYIPIDTLVGAGKIHYYFREEDFWPESEFVIFLASCASEQKKEKDKIDDIPEAVMNAFKDENPDEKFSVEKEGENYLFLFEEEGVEKEILYDKEGNMISEDTEQEVEIDPQTLPQAIRDDIESRYPGAELLEADKVTLDDGSINYEVEIKIAEEIIELIYEENGTYLGIEDEEEEIEED